MLIANNREPLDVSSHNWWDDFLRAEIWHIVAIIVTCRSSVRKCKLKHNLNQWQFLPCDAVQSAVMPQYVVRLSTGAGSAAVILTYVRKCKLKHNLNHWQFLPCNAVQSAVMPQYVIRLSTGAGSADPISHEDRATFPVVLLVPMCAIK